MFNCIAYLLHSRNHKRNTSVHVIAVWRSRLSEMYGVAADQYVTRGPLALCYIVDELYAWNNPCTWWVSANWVGSSFQPANPTHTLIHMLLLRCVTSNKNVKTIICLETFVFPMPNCLLLQLRLKTAKMTLQHLLYIFVIWIQTRIHLDKRSCNIVYCN